MESVRSNHVFFARGACNGLNDFVYNYSVSRKWATVHVDVGLACVAAESIYHEQLKTCGLLTEIIVCASGCLHSKNIGTVIGLQKTANINVDKNFSV